MKCGEQHCHPGDRGLKMQSQCMDTKEGKRLGVGGGGGGWQGVMNWEIGIDI